METIQAMVNPRLLTKASRLFTGTLQGRVIEILQNARRAGATRVEITNEHGKVTVRDNGKGIEDFAKLLDLGGSGWEQALEESEDPAGVGIFCLAPRELSIRSNGRRVTIRSDGWTGVPVKVTADPKPVQGTVLRFEDEPWTREAVEINAVFTGLQVIVDGQECPRAAFVSDQAVHHPDLGCRIEVRESDQLTEWHRRSQAERWSWTNVLVNFHGQVVVLSNRPISEPHLYYLVDMTGEPTGIRLMLPARTQLIENEAHKQLMAALELEAYRYVQRRGHHRLPYTEYLRAKELGIDLPEAKPTYDVGLLSGDDPEPIEVTMPEGFPLARCYRFDPDVKGGAETDEANTHLLAALGKFDEPFVPVSIRSDYDGYSWAKLPTIGKVSVEVGKELRRDWLWSGVLVCVDSIVTTVHTSDGRIWKSPVCMAVQLPAGKDKHHWADDEVLVTPEARRLCSTDILYHLGGYSDEGDTWQTQDDQFSRELDHFWDQLIGPDESLRRRILEPFEGFTDWQQAIILSNGTVTIHFTDGSTKTIEPPASLSE